MRKWVVRSIGVLFLAMAVMQVYFFARYWPGEIALDGIRLGTIRVMDGPVFYTWDWYFLMYAAAGGYFLLRFKELGRKTALMLLWFLLLANG